LQLKRWSELRFIFMRLIVRSEISAVGRADLRHVIIAFAPCTPPSPRAMSRLYSVLTFYGSSSAPLTKNTVADTQMPRYTVAPLIESVNSSRVEACCGQTPPFLIQG
jgi:hypothetical protein